MSAPPPQLSAQIDEMAEAVLRGELRARVSLLSEPEDVQVARSMLNRLVTGAVGSALALASAVMLTVQSGPSQVVRLVNIAGGIGLAFATLLLLRVIMQILRE